MEKTKKDTHTQGFLFLSMVMILLFMGLLALSSASSYHSLKLYNDSIFLLKRQAGFAVMGIIFMIAASKIKFKPSLGLGILGFLASIILMASVFIPGVGRTINGATRWINLGFNFQPSEFLKLALVFFLASYFAYIKKEGNRLMTKDVIFLGFSFAIIGVLLYFQSHLSAMLIITFIFLSMFFISNIKISFKMFFTLLIIAIIIAGVFLKFFIFTEGNYRLERINNFLNQEENVQGGNWQITQSLYAIGSGRILGQGLGQSIQKYSWLPEAQNDFIFAIWAEEFGFIISVGLVVVYYVFIRQGFKIGLKSKDDFSKLLVLGIMMLFAFQIVANIFVVTFIVPTTGIPLPFFSSGGTSLIINLISIGLILKVANKNNLA